MLIESINSPLEKLESDFLNRYNIQLFLKRDDKIHPYISGNKWRKLKYNLKEAKKKDKNTILTFGGAYSNHIYATSFACKQSNINSIGIIRGDELKYKPLNKTLSFAENQGMKLVFVDRGEYRKMNELNYHKKLMDEFGNFYLLPEGGSNELAILGVGELVAEIEDELDFDYIFVACGTGATLAGIIRKLKKYHTAVGVSVLKNGIFLNDRIKKFVKPNKNNWHILTQYSFGGYAKTKPDLINFIMNFYRKYDIKLDQVYTGKLLFAIFDSIKIGMIKPNSNVVAIHSGGLQGAIPSLY